MAQLTPSPKQQFFDDDGTLLAGGLVYTYLTETSTPAATYSDAAGATANANPIVLDSAGRASIFLDTTVTYRFVLKRSDLTTVYTQNGIAASSASDDGGENGNEETADGLTVLYYPSPEFERGAITISYAVPTFPPPGSKDGDLIFVVDAPDTTALRVTGYLAQATLDTAYTGALSPAGGTAPLTVSIVAGSVPPGVSVSSSGAVTGTPTAVGTYNFTVRVTDNTGATVDRPYTLIVADPAAPFPDPGETEFDASGTVLGGYVGVPYMSNNYFGGEGISATTRSGALTEIELTGTIPPGITYRVGYDRALYGIPSSAATYSAWNVVVSEMGAYGFKTASETLAQSVVIAAQPTYAVIDAFARGGQNFASFVTGSLTRFKVKQQTESDSASGYGVCVTLPGEDTAEFYAEITFHSIDASNGEAAECGICATPALTGNDAKAYGPSGMAADAFRAADSAVWRYKAYNSSTGTGQIMSGDTAAVSATRLVSGDVVMIFAQPASGKVWFGRNGTWIGDPTAETGASLTDLVLPVDAYADHFRIYAQGGFDSTDEDDISINCGTSAFTYTPPQTCPGMAYVPQTYPSGWSGTNRTEFVKLFNGVWDMTGGYPTGLEDWDAYAQVSYYYASPAYGSALGLKGYGSGKRQFELMLVSGEQRTTWLGIAPSTVDATDSAFRVGLVDCGVGIRVWDDTTNVGERAIDGVASAFSTSNTTPYTTVWTFVVDADADTYGIYRNGVAVVTAQALPDAGLTWHPAFSGEANAVVALRTKDLEYPVATYSDWVQ